MVIGNEAGLLASGKDLVAEEVKKKESGYLMLSVRADRFAGKFEQRARPERVFGSDDETWLAYSVLVVV